MKDISKERGIPFQVEHIFLFLSFTFLFYTNYLCAILHGIRAHL